MVSHLPNELLLELFPLFPLKCLIAARSVSRTWRNLVPLSGISPARQALLDLYYDVIQTPYFLGSRESVISTIVPFDREAHITSLEEKIDGTLPEEFRLWVLEWPAKAVFGMAWPGLSNQLIGSGFRRKICLCRINPITKVLVNLGDVMSVETEDMDEDHADDDGGGVFGTRAVETRPRHNDIGRSTWLEPDSTEPELYGFMLKFEYPRPIVPICHRSPAKVTLSWVKWLRQTPEFRTMCMSFMNHYS